MTSTTYNVSPDFCATWLNQGESMVAVVQSDTVSTKSCRDGVVSQNRHPSSTNRHKDQHRPPLDGIQTDVYHSNQNATHSHDSNMSSNVDRNRCNTRSKSPNKGQYNPTTMPESMASTSKSSYSPYRATEFYANDAAPTMTLQRPIILVSQHRRRSLAAWYDNQLLAHYSADPSVSSRGPPPLTPHPYTALETRRQLYRHQQNPDLMPLMLEQQQQQQPQTSPWRKVPIAVSEVPVWKRIDHAEWV